MHKIIFQLIQLFLKYAINKSVNSITGEVFVYMCTFIQL